jgi:sugar lactone lactonase YvrE
MTPPSHGPGTARNFLFQSKRSGKEALWAIAMTDGKAAGPPRLVHPDLAIQQTIGLTPAGELYYLTRTGTREVYEVEIDPAAGRVLSEPKPITATVVGDNYNSSYSPDGRSMAYLSARSGRGARTTVIVVRDLASGAEREIDLDLTRLACLSWAPDSAGLLFSGGDRQGVRASIGSQPRAASPSFCFALIAPGTSAGWPTAAPSTI